jgi:hypothetical protein
VDCGLVALPHEWIDRLMMDLPLLDERCCPNGKMLTQTFSEGLNNLQKRKKKISNHFKSKWNYYPKKKTIYLLCVLRHGSLISANVSRKEKIIRGNQ